MSKPKFNLYAIINDYYDNHNELNEFITHYGEMALHNPLKIGKCNYPLTEAIQKNKESAFDIIFKALPLDIIVNQGNYLYNIVYSIKQHKKPYYYNELLNKIKNEDPNNQQYYSKIFLELANNWSSAAIQPIFIEFFSYPLFNIQEFFNSWEYSSKFINRLYNIPKTKLLVLLNVFENHNINQNFLFSKIYGTMFGYYNGITKNLTDTKERHDIFKIFTKNAKLIDLDKYGNWTKIGKNYYSFAEYYTVYSFRLYLLFSAFPNMIKFYDSGFNPGLKEELMELCKDDNIAWSKHFSIFSPITDLNFLVNNFNPELPTNLKILNETLDKYKELLKYLKEIKDMIFNNENPEFKDFILEILSKIKGIINTIFLNIKNPEHHSKKDLFTTYIDEIIEKTNEVFN